MSLAEFSAAVRIAASFLSPDAWADPTHPTADDVVRAYQLADIWLTPAVVEEFSEGDFAGLPDDQRAELRDAVEKFRTAAESVPTDCAATAEQVDAALPHLLTIFELIRPHIVYPEAMTIRRAVWRAWVPYRDWIPAFDFRLDTDWVGDPGVWVWLILNDDVDVGTREVQLRLWDVRKAIYTKLIEAGVERTPYISVWGRSEVARVVLGGARA